MEIKSTAIIGMGALGMMYGTHMLDAGEKNVWFCDGRGAHAEIRDEDFLQK